MATNRISTLYTEAIIALQPTNRISTLYTEIITNAPTTPATNRISTLYVEIINGISPPLRPYAMILA